MKAGEIEFNLYQNLTASLDQMQSLYSTSLDIAVKSHSLGNGKEIYTGQDFGEF